MIRLMGWGLMWLAATGQSVAATEGAHALPRYGGWLLAALLVGVCVVLWLALRRSKQKRRQLLRMMDNDLRLDAITELPTRAPFDDRLTLAVNRHQRQQSQFALLHIRIEPSSLFEQDSADDLLQQLCGTWLQSLRRSDTLARWDLNEFVVLLESLEQVDGATAVARNLINQGEECASKRAAATELNLHIGIAIFPNHGADGISLLQAATESGYKAAEKGSSGYQVA
ncbi:diguanylate cyclase [uncultured Ferrimonas sp.]|uniref:diguanylate cyclase domain-containing protein n=1 Tax=uncultured Ferrimonas sp. TaxID=432640 RepID=UPI002616B81F|nr:diguanylate cyclase [uncultured Ferrimonas sp.]